MYLLSLTATRALRRRGGEDPVPALLAALAPLPLALPAERTAGWHVLALAPRSEIALEVLLRALETGGFAVGLGIGTVPAPLPASVRELTGGAASAAAEALRAAEVTSTVPVAVRAADPRQADTVEDAEAVLRLIGWMVRTRNRGQWRAVRALREDPTATQAQLAERLGVTQQTVSRAVQTGGWREESAAHPLAERLLSMIDLTSER